MPDAGVAFSFLHWRNRGLSADHGADGAKGLLVIRPIQTLDATLRGASDAAETKYLRHISIDGVNAFSVPLDVRPCSPVPHPPMFIACCEPHRARVAPL